MSSSKVSSSAPGTTILISSHDLAEIESFASHVGYLDRGRLQFSEEMAELSARFREIELTLDAPAPTRRLSQNLAAHGDLGRSRSICRFAIRRGANHRRDPKILRRAAGNRDHAHALAIDFRRLGESEKEGCVMKQALHIFRKDIHEWTYEIVVSLVLIAVFIIGESHNNFNFLRRSLPVGSTRPKCCYPLFGGSSPLGSSMEKRLLETASSGLPAPMSGAVCWGPSYCSCLSLFAFR